MKRSSIHITDHLEVEQERKARPNVNKTSNSLNLKSVCTISLQNEFNGGFSLQSVDEFVVLRTKTGAELLHLEKSLGNHQSKIQLSAVKHECPTYEPASALVVNEKRIFHSSSHQEKNDLMLNPTLFPGCILKNHQLAKALLSPYPSDNSLPPILGCLSYNGSLELSHYNYDVESFESSIEKIAEICEIRMKSYALGTYVKLEKLKEIINEISFYSFDWCPVIIGSSRFFAALSKSNEIIIYSINSENEIAVQKFLNLEAVICEIKWIVANDEHFLIACQKDKSIVRISVKFSDDLKVESLIKVDEMEGILNLPVSFMEVQTIGNDTLILCSKAHSLEIVLLNKSGLKSITKHVGVSITGIAAIRKAEPEYLITTLNNKLFYLKLNTENQDLKVQDFRKVDNTLNPDIQPSKFGAYGIAVSRNKVLVYVALFPQLSYDHLVLKQPACLSINTFTRNDPHDILIKNSSHRLTDFYDCVEAIRIIGASKIETLLPIERFSHEFSLDTNFLYYNKLQLIVNSSKMANYETKSDEMKNELKIGLEHHKEVIEVISSYLLLKRIMDQKLKVTERSQLVVRGLTNFLRAYVGKEVAKEPFKGYHGKLKKGIENLVIRIRCKESIKHDICVHCEEPIEKDKLTCIDGHPTQRCSITKVQLPLSSNNFCFNCKVNFVDAKTLNEVLDRSDQLCPFCDRPIMFTESVK